MAAIDDFKARFTEFATADVDSLFPLLYAEYLCYYNFSYDTGNDCNKVAILYFIAHMMVGEKKISQEANKNVQSKSVGSVSISYAVPANENERNIWLTSTKYGQRFLILTQQNKGMFFV